MKEKPQGDDRSDDDQRDGTGCDESERCGGGDEERVVDGEVAEVRPGTEGKRGESLREAEGAGEYEFRPGTVARDSGGEVVD